MGRCALERDFKINRLVSLSMSIPSTLARECSPIIARNCREAVRLGRNALLAIAIARGCHHYAPFVPSHVRRIDRPDLPHEVLGCALLRGPLDVDTFQTIRCGAMILSDLGNSPQIIAEAVSILNVTSRVAHIAQQALSADDHPDYWRNLLAVLPAIEVSRETSFLPGVSRLVSETRITGLGRGAQRVWLRTHHLR